MVSTGLPGYLAFTFFSSYLTWGPSKITSALSPYWSILPTGWASICNSIPFAAAASFILLTSKLVDIPAAHTNKIFIAIPPIILAILL